MALWGNELKRWRETAGLSRPQLGRLAHVSAKNIYNLEMRGQRPTIGTVKALADALDAALSAVPDGWGSSERRQFRLGPAPAAAPPVDDGLAYIDRAATTPPLAQAETDAATPPALPFLSSPPKHQPAIPGTRRRRLVWGTSLAAVAGFAVVVAATMTPGDTTSTAPDSPDAPTATGVPHNDGAVPAIGADISRPRWWLADQHTATKHAGESIAFGKVGDIPVVGNWDSAAGDEPGLYRPSDGNFYWKTGDHDDSLHIDHAQPGDWPVAGDWDRDGDDEPGLYRASQAVFLLGHDGDHLRTVPIQGPAEAVPVVGDWDGDGRDDPGLFDPATRTFQRQLLDGRLLDQVTFGDPGDLPLAGDWTGDSIDEIGVYRPATRTFRFADASGTEIAHVIFGASNRPLIPVVGDWNHDGQDSQGVIQNLD